MVCYSDKEWKLTIYNNFHVVQGIELFGSDFGMVALLFPGRDRGDMKLKYKNELSENRSRIYETLFRQPKGGVLNLLFTDCVSLSFLPLLNSREIDVY